ncbi:hypothetical protein GF385_02830 [Candidatus Dependentiae bacterium]|nr:hypothetical protein [Candidatus Dependentiae bacterium]
MKKFIYLLLISLGFFFANNYSMNRKNRKRPSISSEKKATKKVRKKEEKPKTLKCSICLEEFGEKENKKCKLLCCKQYICETCINNIYNKTKSSFCPYCRKPIKYKNTITKEKKTLKLKKQPNHNQELATLDASESEEELYASDGYETEAEFEITDLESLFTSNEEEENEEQESTAETNSTTTTSGLSMIEELAMIVAEENRRENELVIKLKDEIINGTRTIESLIEQDAIIRYKVLTSLLNSGHMTLRSNPISRTLRSFFSALNDLLEILKRGKD